MKKIVIDLDVVPFFVGFDLAGRRRDDGKIEAVFGLGSEGLLPLLDDWPEEIRMFNSTYSLEKVVKGDLGMEWGEYA